MKFLKFFKAVFGNEEMSNAVKESQTAFELVGRVSMMFFTDLLPKMIGKRD